jgi:hypothetical protein
MRKAVTAFLLCLLVLGSSSSIVAPVLAAPSPKLVVSGITGLSTIASDAYGHLYYVAIPSSTEADLYRVVGGTSKLVFTEDYPSAGYVSLSYVSFDLRGDVYFVAQEIYPPDASGVSQVDSHVYMLNVASNYAPSQLLSASALTSTDPSCYENPYIPCLTSGTVLYDLGTNQLGLVVVGADKYGLPPDNLGNTYQGELIAVSAFTGPRVRATFSGADMSAGGPVVNLVGEAFVTISNSTGLWTLEVTPMGRAITLDQGVSGMALDPWGNLYVITRIVEGHQCAWYALDSIFTIEKFSAVSLLLAKPVSVTVSNEVYPNDVLVAFGLSDQTKATNGGELFYALYPSTKTSCTSATAFTSEIMGLKTGAAHPSVIAQETNPPGSLLLVSIAAYGNNLYYGWTQTGSIYLLSS